MMEKFKTGLLAVLVILSLGQSYLLAYSMPGLGATTNSPQDYIKGAEPMGQEEQVENVIFPQDMVLHLGKGKHTLLYPGTNFYNLIYGKLQSREFKGFQRNTLSVVDWNDVRNNDEGLELRFGQGVPAKLLSKALKLEGDPVFQEDTINRIWIFKNSGRDEVRTYFFSGDGLTIYESVRADLTSQDVQMYVGYGEYQVQYQMVGNDLYTPLGPVEGLQALVGFDRYSAEQMQKNLFLDPAVTRTISDRSGSQIYTDGKRGLQVEQNGKWISFTDPVAGQAQEDNESENVYTAISFINQHGGWDGLHRFIHTGTLEDSQMVLFQQYYSSYPILPVESFLFGEMKLRLQQGVVSEYERSLLTLRKKAQSKEIRWLPGGELLKTTLEEYPRRSEVTALYPALLAAPVDTEIIKLEPVWAVRLRDGTQQVLLGAMPYGMKPQPGEPGGPALSLEGEGGSKKNSDQAGKVNG
ncbi:YycH family regulatory protein [Paenibacillus solisilvae]|uniref:YycH family regulatory protein n=1 Tax=Paenibacillus solisilvae TaxID=2486751 RepID=A0ABW0W511_9BACL